MDTSNYHQMPLDFRSNAEKLIGPHKQSLKACVMNAWEMWLHELDANPLYFFPLTSRSRANLVNDHICQNIQNEFLGKEGVYLSKTRGFLMMGIKDEIILRFKKVDSRLKHSNIPTKQQTEIDLQLPIPGMPSKAPLVTVGYLLDISQVEIQKIVVTFHYKGSLLWHFSIDDEDTSTRDADGSVVRLPIAPIGPVQPPTVKPKKTAEEDKKATG